VGQVGRDARKAVLSTTLQVGGNLVWTAVSLSSPTVQEGVMGEPDDDFSEFVRGRSTRLLRTAVLLTGGDVGHAEDLLQGTSYGSEARTSGRGLHDPG
jgi:hypothetical protein